RLYANCVNTGRYDLISDLAAALQQTLNAGGSGRETGEHFFQGRHFKDFSEQVRQAVGQRLAADGSGPPRNPLTETLWSRNFRVNEELTVEIPQLSRWLVRAYGLTGPETIDVLMIILKEASEFTAAINGSIKDLVRQMNETALLAKLQDAAANPESQLLEFITTGTSEELIPLFSKHVLDVHLINPYLEALARDAESAPASGPAETTPAAEPAESAAPAGAGQSVADSLFD
ncbi:MAG: hypothetical protein V3S29_06645, partial [bacterium]